MSVTEHTVVDISKGFFQPNNVISNIPVSLELANLVINTNTNTMNVSITNVQEDI